MRDAWAIPHGRSLPLVRDPRNARDWTQTLYSELRGRPATFNRPLRNTTSASTPSTLVTCARTFLTYPDDADAARRSVSVDEGGPCHILYLPARSER